jgi:hypothetical protein
MTGPGIASSTLCLQSAVGSRHMRAGCRSCGGRVCNSSLSTSQGQPRMATSQPRNRTRSGSRASALLRPPPGGMDLLPGVRKTGMTPEARRSLCPRQARPGCSTRAFAAPDRRVIESQPVRLSANFLRPERRSTDGQVILKRTSGRSENRPDLLFCGAPLRNRTVDLLLTMETLCRLS